MDKKKELTDQEIMMLRAQEIMQSRHLPMAILLLRQAGMRIGKVDTSFLHD